MVKTPQVKPKDQKAWREWKREQLKKREQNRLRPRLKRKKPRQKPPAPPQRLMPTPFTPRLKPRIKPKKRDKYQVAGLLRKGGKVKGKRGTQSGQTPRRVRKMKFRC